MSQKRRVFEPEIWSSDYDRPSIEFNLKYDFENVSVLDISPYEYYSAISSPLYSSAITRMVKDGDYVVLRLESSSKDSFDIWNVDNTAVELGDRKMKLSQIGGIVKERSGLPIIKKVKRIQLWFDLTMWAQIL